MNKEERILFIKKFLADNSLIGDKSYINGKRFIDVLYDYSYKIEKEIKEEIKKKMRYKPHKRTKKNVLD
jgi:hypothetical protein